MQPRFRPYVQPPRPDTPGWIWWALGCLGVSVIVCGGFGVGMVTGLTRAFAPGSAAAQAVTGTLLPVDVRMNSRPASIGMVALLPGPGASPVREDLLCSVTVSNPGPGTLDLQPEVLEATTSDGSTERAMTLDSLPPSGTIPGYPRPVSWLSATLPPGGTVTGDLMFSVRPGAGITEIRFHRPEPRKPHRKHRRS